MKHKVLKPNVVRGGIAIPLGANYYYMSGRKHKDGGIDIGKNPRTGLEVEDGEVMHINKDNVKVFSSVPFLNGKSPAQKVMGGENPNKVFNAQERYKDKHNINDDGTKKNTRTKAEMGIYDDLDELASKAEPWVSGTSLASAGISLAAPNPITPVITAISNIGGGIIDGYQAIRHGIKGNYKQAAINAGEAALSLFGGKAIKMMAKNKAISKIGKVREEAIHKRYNAKQGNKIYLLRKGFTDEQATEIMLKNAANFVDNSKKFKEVADGIHEAEQNKGTKISAVGDAIMDTKDVATEINNRRKRMGGKDKRNGLYSITVNGRTKLRMYPSTGDLIQSDKMEFGGRRKARLGISNKQEDDIIEYNDATKTKYKINTNNKNMSYGRDYSNPILTVLNKLDESTSTTNNPYTYTGIAPNPAIRGKGIGRTGFNMGRNNNYHSYKNQIANNKQRQSVIYNTKISNSKNIVRPKTNKSSYRVYTPKGIRRNNSNTFYERQGLWNRGPVREGSLSLTPSIKETLNKYRDAISGAIRNNKIYRTNKTNRTNNMDSKRKEKLIFAGVLSSAGISGVGGSALLLNKQIEKDKLYSKTNKPNNKSVYFNNKNKPLNNKLTVSDKRKLIPKIDSTNINTKSINNTNEVSNSNNNVTNKPIINNKPSKPIINSTNANVTNITNKSSVNKSSVNNNNINVIGVANKHTNKKLINNTNRKNNILPKINIGRVEPIGITNTPMNVSKNIKNIPINYNYKSTDNAIPFRYKIKQYIKDNPQTVSDGLGLASNIIGGLITRRKNNRMLNKLKYSDAPIAVKAAKLKTRININPQLDKMRESLSEYERNIDNSTSSSRVALARKQQARLANTLQTNELYGNKENTETELINKDKLNQQTVTDANIREYNLWREKKAAFNNAVLEKKAENDVSLFNTINSGIQDIISRGEKRNSERQTRLAMMAANPNVNPRILKAMGIKGITDEDVAAYDKTYGKKKKSK